MKRRSTDPEALLRQGIALGLHDPAAGRAELRAAAAGFEAAGNAAGQLLACAAQVLFIAVADDDYTGFEAAIAVLAAAPEVPFADAADALLAEAGLLVAGSFNALDAPGLAARAARIEAALADGALPASWRCACALAALGYRHIGMNLEQVLWLELALRPLLADAAVSPRLADEAAHLLVQALYQCEAPAQAVALRRRHFTTGRERLPVITVKLALLDAQMALGAGQADLGRAALAQAEPLLHPREPRPAGWWHLLSSRLELLEGRHRQALTHARLALRLVTDSRLPERWSGVTVMQEGQVLVAQGDSAAAVPFFERAGRAASGSQARFCWCLADLARALHHFDHAQAEAGRAALARGLATARDLAWLNFFRATPAVAARVCALAIEQGIEGAFVREVIAERGLPAARPDQPDWPWPVRVRTLGALRIELQGRPLAFRGKVAKKPLELLLFVVASSGVDVSVATVCFALWPELEGDKARAAFTAALHRLRKLLASDDALLLELGRLGINPRRMWVDCLAFEQLADTVPVAGPLGAPQRGAAERACALVGGSFLQGSEDSAWQMSYRSRLASKHRRLLHLLAAEARARGDEAAALAWPRRAQRQAPQAEGGVPAIGMRFVSAPGARCAPARRSCGSTKGAMMESTVTRRWLAQGLAAAAALALGATGPALAAGELGSLPACSTPAACTAGLYSSASYQARRDVNASPGYHLGSFLQQGATVFQGSEVMLDNTVADAGNAQSNAPPIIINPWSVYAGAQAQTGFAVNRAGAHSSRAVSGQDVQGNESAQIVLGTTATAYSAWQDVWSFSAAGHFSAGVAADGSGTLDAVSGLYPPSYQFGPRGAWGDWYLDVRVWTWTTRPSPTISSSAAPR